MNLVKQFIFITLEINITKATRSIAQWINDFHFFALRKKCPYSELFWSAFSRIRTEHGVSLRIQSECGKIRTRITPNTETFHAVLIIIFFCTYYFFVHMNFHTYYCCLLYFDSFTILVSVIKLLFLLFLFSWTIGIL